jgi:hypothetical protein
MASRDRTVERKIYFYRIDVGIADDGAPVPFRAEAALQQIDSLDFTTEGRYLELRGGDALCSWVDRTQQPQRLRLATIRRTGLPHLEEAGELSPLEISERTGLYEPIHIVFFPGNIVATEFNFYGPRPSRLGAYLIAKAGAPATMTVDPLLRGDIADQLNRLQDIRVFDLKVRASYAETLAQLNEDIGRAFDAVARAGAAQEVQVILRPQPYSRNSLSQRLLGFVRRLASDATVRENASRFHIRGFDEGTGRVEEIDVLRDQLIAKRRMVRLSDRTRAIDSTSAYGAIEEAYEELRPDLEAAASARSA